MLVPIKLDKDRNFKYGMRALDLAEKKIGKPIIGLDLQSLTMYQMAALVWCGLYHEDKNLTIERVMDIIDENSSVTAIMNIVGPALNEALVGPKTAEEKN
jgi:hypothetical protein